MADNAGQQEPPSLDEFSKRLDAARGVEASKDKPKSSDGAELGRGLRVASELLAALLVAGGIGWGLDYVLGTKPWLLIVGVMLGFAAGLINVSRSMAEMDKDASQGNDLPEDGSSKKRD